MALKTIGIVGFQGSGKDTIGDYLVNNYRYKRDSFASPLKDIVSIIFNWPRDMLEGNTKISREWREKPDIWWEKQLDWKNHDGYKISNRLTPRVVLQLFGTDVMRKNFHDDIWVMSLKNRLRNNNSPTVITDCRFPNEMKAIRESGGKVFRVKRKEDPIWFDLARKINTEGYIPSKEENDILSGTHISERAWIGFEFDGFIDNSGTMDDLYNNINEKIIS